MSIEGLYRRGENPGYHTGRCGEKPHGIGAVTNSAYLPGLGKNIELPVYGEL